MSSPPVIPFTHKPRKVHADNGSAKDAKVADQKSSPQPTARILDRPEAWCCIVALVLLLAVVVGGVAIATINKNQNGSDGATLRLHNSSYTTATGSPAPDGVQSGIAPVVFRMDIEGMSSSLWTADTIVAITETIADRYEGVSVDRVSLTNVAFVDGRRLSTWSSVSFDIAIQPPTEATAATIAADVVPQAASSSLSSSVSWYTTSFVEALTTKAAARGVDLPSTLKPRVALTTRPTDLLAPKCPPADSPVTACLLACPGHNACSEMLTSMYGLGPSGSSSTFTHAR